MCLVVIAHLAADIYPLVIAANRDEDYDRPTRLAEFWRDAPDILGGRDDLLGGTWLAISRSRRFAAVTNLRGSEREVRKRSRGELVTSFLRSDGSSIEYAQAVASQAEAYAGFHLFVGLVGKDLALVSTGATELTSGMYALSNAPRGDHWPKEDLAAAYVRDALASARSGSSLANDLIAFLGSAPQHNDPTRDVFIPGDRYGTRSSTVIIASADDEVLFVEQSYLRGGAPAGRREFAFRLD